MKTLFLWEWLHSFIQCIYLWVCLFACITSHSQLQGAAGGQPKVSIRPLRSENKQRRIHPTLHPPSLPPLPHHHHHPSTNAQRSWTTSIWGIILYEIDGWGQPLTERVKTTLRCPLWISMMENRLLKKIYVCSPLPQERATLPTYHPPQLWPIKHVIVVRLNSLAPFSCQLCDD